MLHSLARIVGIFVKTSLVGAIFIAYVQLLSWTWQTITDDEPSVYLITAIALVIWTWPIRHRATEQPPADALTREILTAGAIDRRPGTRHD
jgi:hypothetical protein